VHELVANATFKVECGQSSGSGFSFRHESIVVTNDHVIQPLHASGAEIEVVTEQGQRFSADLVARSPQDQLDFAILRLKDQLPVERHVLQPAMSANLERGTSVIFAGYPHGVPDLLVHQAIISGPASRIGFYVDGSVNGGNSGGPIVAADSGEVVGIVTQRRFMGGAQLDALRQEVGQLSRHCQGVAGRGQVVIMGVDFGAFARMMAGGFSVMDQLLQANANSGIGIGFDIRHVNTEYTNQGLPS